MILLIVCPFLATGRIEVPRISPALRHEKVSPTGYTMSWRTLVGNLSKHSQESFSQEIDLLPRK